MPRSEISGSCGSCIVSVFFKLPSCFKVATLLHSSTSKAWASVSPRLHQHSMLSLSFISVILVAMWYLMIFTHISLMADKTGWTYFHALICHLYVLRCQMALYVFCPFCPHLKGLFSLTIEFGEFFIYSRYFSFCQTCDLQMCSPALWSVFHPLNRIYYTRKVFSFLWSLIHPFFLQWVIASVSSLRAFWFPYIAKIFSYFFLKVLCYTYVVDPFCVNFCVRL